jgi:hypothetical protein
MKRQRLMCIGLVVSLLAWASVGAQAQAPSQDAKKTQTTALTGCLEKGTDANSFVLKDAMPAAAAKEQSKEAPKSADMRSYHVMTKASSIKLAEHVGHKVTLTGTLDERGGGSTAGTPKTGTAGSAGTAGTAGESKAGAMPHLTVTSMKHLAPTCTP